MTRSKDTGPKKPLAGWSDYRAINNSRLVRMLILRLDPARGHTPEVKRKSKACQAAKRAKISLAPVPSLEKEKADK